MITPPVVVQDRPAGGESANRAWLRALETTSQLAADPARVLAHLVDELGERHGDAPALLSSSGVLSFRELAERARRYARWAHARGLGAGDVVALMAPNSPDYFAAWVGVSRTGAAVALLNTQLEGPALAHCLAVSHTRVTLVEPDLRQRLGEACRQLKSDAPDIVPMEDGLLDPLSAAPLEWTGGASQSDRALLIFTSGTTGRPKAANVSHGRVLSWCGWFAGMMGASPDDRLYNCLPMYHSVGGVVAIGGVLLKGGSVFIREKFSAAAFWEEIVRYDCTLFQYIGELCRFLVNAPAHPQERAHRLRLACGNGLREDVWTAFQSRFAIPRVLEFYAATEGNFSLYNVEGRPGAIGRVPPMLAHRFPASIVRYDAETGAPHRDGGGRCVRCEVDEAGEAIGRIAGPEAGGPTRFEGYTNAAESEKKVLRDVFEPGDAWFRTGDLMRRDKAGFFYFVDRVGDTFRWKGENVSTAEVADVIAACPGVQSAAVYGVKVAGCEGRAGMAAVSGRPDLAELSLALARDLPPYARPIFLRVCPDLATTETFKLKKADLAEEGYDPARVRDALFILRDGAYRALDAATFEALEAGALRL